MSLKSSTFRACLTFGKKKSCAKCGQKRMVGPTDLEARNCFASSASDMTSYCGNTAVDLDPLPLSRARLTVVEPAFFE
jgi:hypothetical protein